MNAANRDASPTRKGVAWRQLKGRYGNAFLITVPAKRTMHQLLAQFGTHPKFQDILIGIEPYPTDPTRHHYHIVVTYTGRIHLAFSGVGEACGASADVRSLQDTAAVSASSVYAIKHGHGLFYPPTREAFVRRASPKAIQVDTWTADQMKDMGGYEELNGAAFRTHCQFFPPINS